MDDVRNLEKIDWPKKPTKKTTNNYPLTYISYLEQKHKTERRLRTGLYGVLVAGALLVACSGDKQETPIAESTPEPVVAEVVEQPEKPAFVVSEKKTLPNIILETIPEPVKPEPFIIPSFSEGNNAICVIDEINWNYDSGLVSSLRDAGCDGAQITVSLPYGSSPNAHVKSLGYDLKTAQDLLDRNDLDERRVLADKEYTLVMYFDKEEQPTYEGMVSRIGDACEQKGDVLDCSEVFPTEERPTLETTCLDDERHDNCEYFIKQTGENAYAQAPGMHQQITGTLNGQQYTIISNTGDDKGNFDIEVLLNE